VLDIGEYSNEF